MDADFDTGGSHAILSGMAEYEEACRLCGQLRPLCRSHIVPELAYEPIKNEKDQTCSVGHKTKKVQTGYYERLLCQECETHLSRYENCFKQTWMDTIPPDFRHLHTSPHEDVISVPIADYAAFKLFHLSVFWRAAVSSGFKIDPKVSFGPYTDRIAELVRAGNPGPPGHFPFLASLNLDGRGRPVPMVTQLAQGEGRLEGRRYYMMAYAYSDWVFVIGRRGPQWLTDLETMYMEKRIFLLLPVRHTQAKSFRLGVQMLRRLRRQG